MEAIREMIVEEDISAIEKAQAISGAKDSRLRDKRPDPEVAEKPERRRFTADYKLRILAEADACKSPGEVGALLRREGLYSSHLSRWRKKLRSGALGALSSKKRGPEPDPAIPFKKRISELEREVAQLKKKLAQAETIIDVQKKVSGLLGMQEKQGEENS